MTGEIMQAFSGVMKTHMSFITLLLLCVFPASASAEIYQWKDSSGNVFYTDSPPPGVKTEEKRFREQRIERPAVKEEAPRAVRRETGRLRPYSDIQVVMYMTSWCPYCKKAREFINATGARLTEYDIDKDSKKNEEMMRKSGGNKGVPLIDIEGAIINGYSPAAIKSAIEDKRRM